MSHPLLANPDTAKLASDAGFTLMYPVTRYVPTPGPVTDSKLGGEWRHHSQGLDHCVTRAEILVWLTAVFNVDVTTFPVSYDPKVPKWYRVYATQGPKVIWNPMTQQADPALRYPTLAEAEEAAIRAVLLFLFPPKDDSHAR